MQLTNAQWQEACQLFEEITQLISDIIQTTCTAPPFPQLTNNTNRLGGFLPRKLQNQWKKHLTKHHLTRKIIYIVKNNPNWRQHPILYQLTSIDAL
jgi:NAD-specific glutamate dehydrogenase